MTFDVGGIQPYTVVSNPMAECTVNIDQKTILTIISHRVILGELCLRSHTFDELIIHRSIAIKQRKFRDKIKLRSNKYETNLQRTTTLEVISYPVDAITMCCKQDALSKRRCVRDKQMKYHEQTFARRVRQLKTITLARLPKLPKTKMNGSS